MTVTEDAQASERWAAAEGIADGVMDSRMPRRRRVVWLWVSTLILGSSTLGVVLALVLPHTGAGHGDDSGIPVRLVVGWAFQGVGILVGTVGFIWAVRTGRYITRWRSVASPLTAQERRWVQKTIRSGTVVDDGVKRRVLVAMARQNRRVTVGIVPLYIGMTLMALGVGISSPFLVTVWFEVAAVATFVLVFAFLARDYRRAGRYLERFA